MSQLSGAQSTLHKYFMKIILIIVEEGSKPPRMLKRKQEGTFLQDISTTSTLKKFDISRDRKFKRASERFAVFLYFDIMCFKL